MTYTFSATRNVTVDGGAGTFKQTAVVTHANAPATTQSDAEAIRLLRWCGILGNLDAPAWTASQYDKETFSEIASDNTSNTGENADIDITFQRYASNLSPKLLSFRVENVNLENAATAINNKIDAINFVGSTGSGLVAKSIIITLHN